MKYRNFGNTELKVSEIGFGAWGIGGPVMAGDIPIGWGDVEDRTSIKALKKAFDLGINFYDTADFYGLGHSEELIGNLWGNRKDVIIASKVGHRIDSDNNIYLDYSYNYIIRACEKSLRRLKREQVDLYQLHAAKLSHLENGSCIKAMNQLQSEGKVKYWGISLNTYDPEPEADFMLKNGFGQGFQIVFNIINQKALSLLQNAANHGMGVIARMPLQFGLLTGKFNRDVKFPKTDHRSFRLTPEILHKSLVELEPVWKIGEKYKIDKASFVLSFILSHPDISTVIPGIKTPEQAIANTKNIAAIKEDDLKKLHDLYKERFMSLLEFMKQHG